MYEDSWYSFVPESHPKNEFAASQASKHRRRESLLKQPNVRNPSPQSLDISLTEPKGSNQASDIPDAIMELYEDTASLKGPPKATLARRAKSYSDFYDAAVIYLSKETVTEKPRDAFALSENVTDVTSPDSGFEDFEDDLLDESREEYRSAFHITIGDVAKTQRRLYRDQLVLSERHLDTLLNDTTGALDSLASLSKSFEAVESETTAFQAQCEDLLAEQKRLRDLADEVGTDLQYYAYLEPLTRRLNAPGSGRLVRNDDFVDMLLNLNTCIDFMDHHVSCSVHVNGKELLC